MKGDADHIYEILEALPVDRWGIGDLADYPGPAWAGYNCAISLLFAYEYDPDGYDEAVFHQLLLEKQGIAEAAVAELCGPSRDWASPAIPSPTLKTSAAWKPTSLISPRPPGPAWAGSARALY